VTTYPTIRTGSAYGDSEPINGSSSPGADFDALCQLTHTLRAFAKKCGRNCVITIEASPLGESRWELSDFAPKSSQQTNEGLPPTKSDT